MPPITGMDVKQDSKTMDMLCSIDVALTRLNDRVSDLWIKSSPFCVSVEVTHTHKEKLSEKPATSRVLESIGQINRRVDGITERVSDLLNRLDG